MDKVGDVEVFLETPADGRYLQDYIKATAKQHFLGGTRTSKNNFSLQTVSNQLNAALEQAPGSEAEKIARMGLAEINAKSDELAAKAADARKREFMTKMSKLTNRPEETFAKSGRINAGIVNIKWEFDEQGKAYTSVDFRLSTDEVLKKLSENGLLENK